MSQAQPRVDRNAREGRILARPIQPTATITAGIHPLHVAGKDALLYVPVGYQASRPAPLALLCHGAGGNAGHGLYLLQSLADAMGLLILAPAS